MAFESPAAGQACDQSILRKSPDVFFHPSFPRKAWQPVVLFFLKANMAGHEACRGNSASPRFFGPHPFFDLARYHVLAFRREPTPPFVLPRAFSPNPTFSLVGRSAQVLRSKGATPLFSQLFSHFNVSLGFDYSPMVNDIPFWRFPPF